MGGIGTFEDWQFPFVTGQTFGVQHGKGLFDDRLELMMEFAKIEREQNCKIKDVRIKSITIEAKEIIDGISIVYVIDTNKNTHEFVTTHRRIGAIGSFKQRIDFGSGDEIIAMRFGLNSKTGIASLDFWVYTPETQSAKRYGFGNGNAAGLIFKYYAMPSCPIFAFRGAVSDTFKFLGIFGRKHNDTINKKAFVKKRTSAKELKGSLKHGGVGGKGFDYRGVLGLTSMGICNISTSSSNDVNGGVVLGISGVCLDIIKGSIAMDKHGRGEYKNTIIGNNEILVSVFGVSRNNPIEGFPMLGYIILSSEWNIRVLVFGNSAYPIPYPYRCSFFSIETKQPVLGFCGSTFPEGPSEKLFSIGVLMAGDS